MTIQEADRLANQSKKLSRLSLEMHAKAKEVAQIHYGLESGVTILRSEDVVGSFLEVLNYFEGQLPWVSVRVILPQKDEGKRRHFYQPWVKISSAETDNL